MAPVIPSRRRGIRSSKARVPRFARDGGPVVLGAAESAVAGLLRPEAYDHPADDLLLHETHVSWVVLAGPYAYKLKKPVDLGFVDLSTFERRAANAEAEVQLNRRFAPEVYLGTVDVVERDGAVHVGGEGRVLERAVWMRRLPAEGLLRLLLEQGSATSHLVRRIARAVARIHTEAPTGPGVDEHGSLPAIEANWRQNFEQIASYVGEIIPAWELTLIREYVEDRLSSWASTFRRRAESGRVRDGHGDLHADSICVLDGRPVFFDCLEFSARYRCSDVASEVAFLAMDLDHTGRADLGWVFVSEYVRASGDQEVWRLLDFYKCYRAFVRGKVRALRTSQAGLDAEEREAVRREARAYFNLAASYARASNLPRLVVLTGLPASGKSTLAAALASRLGMVRLSTDLERKRAVGLRPTDRADAGFAEGIYTPGRTRLTYAALRRSAARWIRRGVSVVLDGTHATRSQRGLGRALAKRLGARFLLIETRCSEAEVPRRLARRASDPRDPSDATWGIYTRMREAYEPPEEFPERERLIDRSGGEEVDPVVERILHLGPAADLP